MSGLTPSLTARPVKDNGEAKMERNLLVKPAQPYNARTEPKWGTVAPAQACNDGAAVQSPTEKHARQWTGARTGPEV